MKNLRKFKQIISLLLVNLFLFSCTSNGYSLPNPPTNALPLANNSIKIALLLDTSSSMNGLLEQAKSQLWKIVNVMSTAQKNGNAASLEIALYQYGNDELNSKEGYIENVLPLSSDLDELSEKLFALRTNGGSEYCGHVIQTATNQLNWNETASDLNLIFIAGNEAFNQGRVSYESSCKNALSKNITVNTIFCGDYQTGVSGLWSNGALLTEGSYMNIDMNQKTIYVETPYDKQISELNDSLNATYLSYGRMGRSKKQKQVTQDNNSANYGLENKVSRAVSKSSHLYSNSSWDLVDASKEKDFDISKIEKKSLPESIQNLSNEKRLEYINIQAKKRKEIQHRINLLNKKRLVYIEATNSANSTNSLDYAMIKAIKKQAQDKGFSFFNPTTINPQLISNCVHSHLCCQVGCSCCPETPVISANVDFDYFEETTKKAKAHRQTRLIDFKTFKNYSLDNNTIILDTRSKTMYDQLHIKGAIHLNFSDFTEASLRKLIPNKNTRILIYCNNNFKQEPTLRRSFPTKSRTQIVNAIPVTKTLALNIPTYITLFGYGYKNVYELSELVSSNNKQLELEGTEFNKPSR